VGKSDVDALVNLREISGDGRREISPGRHRNSPM
jgi:hypothetical protein